MTSITPSSNDGAALGDTTHNFSDLFLASGALINYANGDVVSNSYCRNINTWYWNFKDFDYN